MNISNVQKKCRKIPIAVLFAGRSVGSPRGSQRPMCLHGNWLDFTVAGKGVVRLV